ncbi:MAG: transposase [Euryarchaeota archaeon]|nr:transposase [Euryarchaeota archaeon]
MRSASLIRLTDDQWKKLEPLLPKQDRNRRAGRPWADSRGVFEGILWILKTGARWRDLPDVYPSPATCWRRLNRWEIEGVWERVWHEYLRQLDEKNCLGWEECFMDATFMPAKRGATRSVKHVKERERSSWWWQTVKVYRSESTSRLQTLARRLSPKKRSELYGYLAQEDLAGLARFLKGLWPTKPTTSKDSETDSADAAST